MRHTLALLLLSACADARDAAVCDAVEDYVMESGYPEAFERGSPPNFANYVPKHDAPAAFTFHGCDNTMTSRKDRVGTTEASVSWTGFDAPVMSVEATMLVDLVLFDQGWSVESVQVRDVPMCGEDPC